MKNKRRQNLVIFEAQQTEPTGFCKKVWHKSNIVK